MRIHLEMVWDLRFSRISVPGSAGEIWDPRFSWIFTDSPRFSRISVPGSSVGSWDPRPRWPGSRECRSRCSGRCRAGTGAAPGALGAEFGIHYPEIPRFYTFLSIFSPLKSPLIPIPFQDLGMLSQRLPFMASRGLG